MSRGELCIIPARGGSRRLPRKNVLEVAGRPMLAWPIAAARASGLFGAIIVSTEDDDIARVAEQAGARVLARPASLATDAATIAEVCLDAVARSMDANAMPEAFCCLLPTAVFATPQDLVQARALLDAPPPADIVLGVSPYTLHPWKALRAEGPFLGAAEPGRIALKSQDHPAFVASNGTLIWARSAPFRARPAFYVERLKGHVMDPLRSQDVDTPEDLDRVRRLAPLFLT